MTAAETLKDCPKCGSPDTEISMGGTIGRRWCNGRCRVCRHIGPELDGWNKAKATELWNKEAAA